MAMNIKSEEAHRLATEIAKLTGTSITEAVTEALRRRRLELDRSEREARIRELLGEMRARLNGAELPDIDALLYDPHTGLPR